TEGARIAGGDALQARFDQRLADPAQQHEHEFHHHPGQPQRQQGEQAGQKQALQALAERGGCGHARILGERGRVEANGLGSRQPSSIVSSAASASATTRSRPCCLARYSAASAPRTNASTRAPASTCTPTLIVTSPGTAAACIARAFTAARMRSATS